MTRNLTEADLALTGPGLEARAQALLDQYAATVAELHSDGYESDELIRREQDQLDYLADFVEAHELNYSRWDPRNAVLGKAEEPPA